jgi:hypothetical protein
MSSTHKDFSHPLHFLLFFSSFSFLSGLAAPSFARSCRKAPVPVFFFKKKLEGVNFPIFKLEKYHFNRSKGFLCEN